MRARVDERWVNPEHVLVPSAKSYREHHLSAVRNIADEYFPFPTPEFPHYRTFVNEPEVEQKIYTNYGRELTPDIVTLQWPEKHPVMVADVVTPDMLTDEAAADWQVLSRIRGCTFLLYVPAGHGDDAKKLLKRHKIKNVALRTWRHITGLKTIDVAHI
ncbi:MAG TPA: hypothetical protein VH951_07995 [Dehalococcoidia bacterium]|jgi:hypothetical protein